ncbi:MAG: DUF5362 family protein [Treponema sp.]|jgi:hypothetical protein|nr:DUF5362 family protein [Treponema sp.]
MSDTNNPYQSPEANVSPVKPLVSQGLLTETMLIHLKGASPWLRFIGILGFISCGGMFLGGIGFIALFSTVSEVWGSIPGIEAYSDVIGAVFAASTGVLFLIYAVLYLFPSLFIYNFGNKIRSYMRNGADQDLEAAFKNNKSLWKYLGILAIISLAFIPVLVIAGIIAAVVMALG